MNPLEESLELHYPQCLEADFGPQLPIAIDAVESIIAAIAGVDFEPLIRRSPGLAGNDWSNYLRCSITRMVHALAALSRRGLTGGRVLDYGSYFGNFALMFARAGYRVDAVDAFRTYEGAFDRTNQLLEGARVRPIDFADVGHDLHGLDAASYDVVLCMGVIEHVPDTPRHLLGSLNRVLAADGQLVIDTPNLVHLYNRQKFARGESVMPDLESFFHGEGPFEGHHREYTMAELVWLLRQIGHTHISLESFNYSLYGAGTLVGRDVYNHWMTVRDPTLRELLMTVSTRPGSSDSSGPAPSPPLEGWQSVLADPETAWQRALPQALRGDGPDARLADELMIQRLQSEINRRDEMLQALQAQVNAESLVRASMQSEINLRDEIIDRVRQEMARLTRGWRRFIVGRPRL